MPKNTFTIYDRNVESYALNLAAGGPALAITADEEHKTLQTAEEICRWLMSEGAGRDALLLAVGGGVTTDLVGFCAAVYKRGVRYANYPTTLLAMVDASIGGKTGCNLDGFKNQIGAFRMPEFTHYNVSVLKTLPEREFRSGAAEMLKTFIIKDGGNYRKAVEALSGAPDYDALAPLIEAAAAVKAGIVKKDPFEGGLRRVLNLGHTWGHAVEWRFPGKYSHGEAVAMGLAEAARISEELGFCATGLAAEICADLASCGLPTALPCPKEELAEAVRQDKKADGGKINFIIIKNIGKVATTLIPAP